MGYIDYFLPEFSKFLYNKSNVHIELFNEKRKNGENDGYVAQLIRNDSIIEFIKYVNKNNISLLSEINISIFETNLILLKKNNISLIEYAAFFGSLQIIKYLYMNGVELTSNLWNFAVHGKNPNLIHILEEFHICSPDQNFCECYIESLKCHHIDFMEFHFSLLIQLIPTILLLVKHYYNLKTGFFNFLHSELTI